ncbi:MAG: type II toxin-antitoxin system VapC family toxin [Acidobacteriota bacterium]|nr:type II toxin-antitoxin system VapC family toxin [Acidobacteriota bacterium]
MSHERVLLDTNVVIGLFAGDPRISDRLAAKQEVFLPVPTLGELYRGAFGSTRRSENLRRIEQFAQAVPVLSCDAVTARHYAELKQALLERGRPIPENDLWIAGIAAQHSLSVMTRDAHFNELRGVEVEFLEL